MNLLKRWIWKLTGRCKHCGSKDLKYWNDFHFGKFSRLYEGKLCQKCNFVTLDK